MPNEETVIEEIGVDSLNDLLKGADDQPRSTIFSHQEKPHLGLNDVETLPAAKPATQNPPPVNNAGDDLDNPTSLSEIIAPSKPAPALHTQVANNITVSLKKLIEDKVLFPFEAEEGQPDKPIEEYTPEEIQDLIKANFEKRQASFEEKLPVDFIESLSQDLQYLAKYELDGGKDLAKVMRFIAEMADTRDIDIKTPVGQERAVREWLASTGVPEEDVEDEITSLKDRNELEKKASKFKPLLEQKKQEQVQREMAEADRVKKTTEAQTKKYQSDVLATLQKGVIENLNLNTDTQGMLFEGMARAMYPIRDLINQTGTKTNLEHLLQVMWLLRDPKGFREEFAKSFNKEKTEKTIRELKTAEKSQAAGAAPQRQLQPASTVQRPRGNVFRRTT